MTNKQTKLKSRWYTLGRGCERENNRVLSSASGVVYVGKLTQWALVAGTLIRSL